jgi:carboxyl-terminal processing protease
MVSDNIGYIRLANFTTDCNKEVERAVKDLKSKSKAKGLILDLRGNPGGLLFEAVKVVNLFVQKNELVVYTKSQIKEFDQQYKTPSRPIDTEIPIVVLVDRASASASEIVAGALQDLDRAVIVGERTFGKGLVQATRPLPYNTQLKITTAKYYIPSGRCIQAVDYTQRDENAGLRSIPDSLVSEFKTRNGRSVYDGGGITPDIQHQLSLYSAISSVLYARNILFDYATLYRHSNKQINSPDSFNLTDKEFENFMDYLEQIGFEYQSQTEYQLNELVKASKQEDFMPLIQVFVDSIQSVIAKNRQKEIYTYSFEIKKLLEEEIVSRYYLQQGRSKYLINNDKAIPISLEIFNDSNRYLNILSKTIKGTVNSEI